MTSSSKFETRLPGHLSELENIADLSVRQAVKWRRLE